MLIMFNMFNVMSKSNLVISPIQYIGSYHPYKVFTIVNMCISSSLFLSSYTVAKTSIYLYIQYSFNNSILFIFLLLFFVLYPIIFIILIHPFIISTISNSLVYKSYNLGILISNVLICVLTFVSFVNLYILFYINLYFIYSICYLMFSSISNSIFSILLLLILFVFVYYIVSYYFSN